jgi:hypothetical protein
MENQDFISLAAGRRRKNEGLMQISLEMFQALKYRSDTDIVRPIREIVRRRKETTGHSVRPK